MNPEFAEHNPTNPLDRRLELLADRALEGLDPTDSAELADLQKGAEVLEDPLEWQAAALTAHWFQDAAVASPLPDELASRILAQASPRVPGVPQRRRPLAVLPWAGWALAAASWLLVVFRPPVSTPPEPAKPVVSQTVPESVEVRRERLLAQSNFQPLTATEHPLARGASGDLVWNQGTQKGFLKLEGLAPTDARTGVYQLWIFDAKRDARYPIDGGTFQIANNNTPTIVPIRAQLAVNEPTLFAITLEPPGGVVVSDRKRIMLTANLQGGRK